MAKPAKKPAKAKPVAKKTAPAKAKKPAAKAKPAAVKKPAPVKKPVAKKPAPKKPAPVKKSAPVKKPVAKKPAPAPKKAPAKAKPAPKKPVAPAAKKTAPKAKPAKPTKPSKPVSKAPAKPTPKNLPPLVKKAEKPIKLSGWTAKQLDRLLQLKDELLDAMNGVGRDTLRTRAEGSDASAFGMHTGDAGSDAYDRDFALSLLSQERDSLFEIDAALKKIKDGNYGICEISGKSIPRERLEARPFARYTVECQSELEKTNRLHQVRRPVTSLFGLTEEEAEGEEEESATESKE
jgi:RNA polymerase-binding transcription factor DksA